MKSKEEMTKLLDAQMVEFSAEFQEDLTRLIHRHGVDKKAKIPDYVLASAAAQGMDLFATHFIMLRTIIEVGE